MTTKISQEQRQAMMAAVEEKKERLVNAMTIEQLIEAYEAANAKAQEFWTTYHAHGGATPEQAADFGKISRTRIWISMELEKRDPAAHAAWMASETWQSNDETEDTPRRFYLTE